MTVIAATTSGQVFVEVGAILLLLSVVGRVAARFSVPAIPLYVIAGLVLGEGSLVTLEASQDFLSIGADIGVVLLLLLLGLEYTPEEFQAGMRSNWRAGLIDLVTSFTPGLVAGFALGWDPVAAVLLGGITYVSSSGIIAKLLSDLDRIANRETPVVLAVLVFEDIAMAVFLPIAGVLVVGASPLEGAVSVAVALLVVVVAVWISSRYSTQVSRMIHSHSREILVLTVLGLTFLVSGLAERVQVSAAVGAFLLGVTLSGQVAETGREMLEPIRDVFGAIFFVYFGLQIDPSTLAPVAVPALLLAVVTAATKIGTGWWAASRIGIGPRGRARAALSLVPRGEFSIVIAEIGVIAAIEADLGPFAACYVLSLAIAGSLLMRFADDLPVPGARRPAGRRGRASVAAAGKNGR